MLRLDDWIHEQNFYRHLTMPALTEWLMLAMRSSPAGMTIRRPYKRAFSAFAWKI